MRTDILTSGVPSGLSEEWVKAPDAVVPLALFLATQPSPGPTGQSFSLMRRTYEGHRSSHAATGMCDVVFRFARDSPLEGGGFELSVPGDGQSRCSRLCAARLLGMDRRTGAGVPRYSSIIMRGKPSTMPPHARG